MGDSQTFGCPAEDRVGPLSVRHILILALTSLVVAGLMRFTVFGLSVIDVDESIYLLVSRDVLSGVMPYDGWFDHKPVALYYLFALSQVVFGEGVHSIRLLAILVSAGTAFLLSLLLRMSTEGGVLSAAAAGAIYALLSVLNGGLATNTEILINFYMAGILLVANTGGFDSRFLPWRAVALGALLGLMVHTNYLASFLVVGFAFAYLISICLMHGIRQGLRVYLQNGAAIMVAFVGVSIVLLAPIAIWGDLGGYFLLQVRFLTGYHQDSTMFSFVRGVLLPVSQYGAFVALGATLTVFLTWSAIRRISQYMLGYAVAWQAIVLLASASLASVASGHLFPHYFILLLPSLTIMAGLFLAWVPSHLRAFCAALLIVHAGLLATRPFTGWIGETLTGRRADFPIKIAEDLRSRAAFAGGEESLYVYDYQPILYYLLGVSSPTMFVILDHISRLGYDRTMEETRIMSQRPRFVIVSSDPAKGRYGAASEALQDSLQRDYCMVKEYEKAYRRKNSVFLYERCPKSTTE